MISFNSIPSDARVPFIFVEFDTSKAQQGPSLKEFKALLIGNKLAAGTKAADEVVNVTSASQAQQYFGAGSVLAKMVEAFLAANKVTGLYCIPMDDDGAGVAATGDVAFSGPVTAAGTLSAMIGGTRYRIAVAADDTVAEIVAALVAEIQADPNRVVTAAVNGVDDAQMDLTARNKGEHGNYIDIRFNYYVGEEFPAGLSAVITDMVGGSGNPDVADAIVAMGEEQYDVIGMAWSDAANMAAMETELEDRWGPIRQNDGRVFVARKDSHANLLTYGGNRNSAQSSVMGVAGPTNPFEWAANIAAVVALNGGIDPARPFQTLDLVAVKAPNESERFSYSERELQLKGGIATHNVVSGVVKIERLITTFQEDDFGNPSNVLLDVNTPMTLSYLRYDFRTRMQAKYPRHKLADDGINFAPGQVVITPSIAKAEAIAIFRDWESLALVENIDQFKRDLIVERNESDPNRLDFLLPPDLVNQFRIGAAQIAFLL